MPADHKDAVCLLPVSGGADSSYLAIMLHSMFPHVEFRMFFTDTLAEDPEIEHSLKRLEVFLGRPIERLKPELGLFEMIEGRIRWQALPNRLGFDVGWAYLAKGEFAKDAPGAVDASPLYFYSQVTVTL